MLTPLAIDPGHPFPHLLNKSLNLAVMMRRPSDDEQLFAVVQAPAVLAAVRAAAGRAGRAGQARVHGPGDGHPHAPAGPLPRHGPGSDAVFRVTRNSDFEIDDDEVEDLLKTIEEEVRKRRRGAAVRLQIEDGAPVEVEQFLTTALDLDASDVIRIPGLLDLSGLFQIHGLPGYPHLRDKQFVPQPAPEFAQAPDPFTAIRGRDILVHHPYESFSHVVDFVNAAADDERVLAIKQTLYRTSSDSPIVRALQRAADNGKQVTAVIELKARLDEERNIVWARELEKSGVHVVFGFIGLKTHCKVCLVVRREEDGIRRYVHLATGNYNPQTARIYTDLGYFTCNPDFCEDASALFNYLTGYGELPQWRKLIVAPSRMQSFMIEKIDAEAALQKAGKEGRIIAKINGLLEPAIVEALYRASQAGVKIDIICRGICALRPGLPGCSETIRVTSIVDRFLEHSRIYYFGNGGDPLVLHRLGRLDGPQPEPARGGGLPDRAAGAEEPADQGDPGDDDGGQREGAGAAVRRDVPASADRPVHAAPAQPGAVPGDRRGERGPPAQGGAGQHDPDGGDGPAGAAAAAQAADEIRGRAGGVSPLMDSAIAATTIRGLTPPARPPFTCSPASAPTESSPRGALPAARRVRPAARREGRTAAGGRSRKCRGRSCSPRPPPADPLPAP